MNKIALSIAICGLIFTFSLPTAAQTSTFIDSRDGKKYRTVKIGKLTWMAQNLNFSTDNSNGSDFQKYGRLYDWDDAMTVCPVGWRLPTRKDWNDLVQAVGGDVAGKKLRSKTWNGTDDFGFSALPGGLDDIHDGYVGIGSIGNWWGAIENNKAYVRGMNSNSERLSEESSEYFSYRFSIRCVQSYTNGVEGVDTQKALIGKWNTDAAYTPAVKEGDLLELIVDLPRELFKVAYGNLKAPIIDGAHVEIKAGTIMKVLVTPKDKFSQIEVIPVQIGDITNDTEIRDRIVPERFRDFRQSRGDFLYYSFSFSSEYLNTVVKKR